MAVKASSNITIYHVIDIASVTIYYLLQSSTANPPVKPTTDNPGGNWTTTEPTYTEGSTNTLYTVTKTKYSDDTFEYTPVSKSTSYEASKDAYIKAVNALGIANTAANKVIISANTPSTPASPYEQLWYDTVNNVYKKYFPAEYESGQEVIPAGWREVTNTIAYIDDIASDAKDALEEAKGINTKISESISNYDDLIRNYIQDKVQAAFSLSKNQAQISIMKTLFNTTKQPGETWYEGTAVKKEGNTVTSSQAGAVGDYYLNNETGDIFKCTTAGTLSTAVWSYERSILDSGGGSLNNVTTYFKFTSDDLLIGKDSYNHKLSLQPDRILMKYYDPTTSKWVDISWWNSTQFVANYIQAIENIITNSIDISNQIKIGNFIFKKNNDGSLSLKIGG